LDKVSSFFLELVGVQHICWDYPHTLQHFKRKQIMAPYKFELFEFRLLIGLDYNYLNRSYINANSPVFGFTFIKMPPQYPLLQLLSFLYSSHLKNKHCRKLNDL